MSDRIELKIDRIEEHLGKQAITLERLTVSVEEHVKRTNLLESEVRPIKRHVLMVEGALKLLGGLGVLAAVLEALHALFK